MTEYFDTVDTDLPFTRNRRYIIDGVKQFVEDEFNAETSQLNLNVWKLRFDVDATDRDELTHILESVNQLIENECPFNFELEWEIIPTNSNGNKNGWFSIGNGNEEESQIIRGGSYPVEAFRVTVPRDHN